MATPPVEGVIIDREETFDLCSEAATFEWAVDLVSADNPVAIVDLYVSHGADIATVSPARHVAGEAATVLDATAPTALVHLFLTPTGPSQRVRVVMVYVLFRGEELKSEEAVVELFVGRDAAGCIVMRSAEDHYVKAEDIMIVDEYFNGELRRTTSGRGSMVPTEEAQSADRHAPATAELVFTPAPEEIHLYNDDVPGSRIDQCGIQIEGLPSLRCSWSPRCSVHRPLQT